MGPALAQRRKAGVPEKQLRDQRAGYPLGRMVIWRMVTEEQHQAGVRLAFEVGRARVLQGYLAPWVKAFDIDAVRGLNLMPDPADDTVHKAQRRVAEAFGAIRHACKSKEQGWFAMIAVRTVCVDEIDAGHWQKTAPHMWQALHVGLHALTGHYGLTDRIKSFNRY